MTSPAAKPAQCQVRSGTDHPCPYPAVVRIRGVSFCERCAREQEAYFAIGELTEARGIHTDKRLVGVLDLVRRTAWRADEPDAA